MDSTYSMIDFHSRLKVKYNDYLKKDLVSIVMIQSEDAVYLETVQLETAKSGLEKQTVKRINLNFIMDDNDEESFFNPNDGIEENVERYINEFSPYSIVNTCDLFHDAACEKISKKYNTFGVDD